MTGVSVLSYKRNQAYVISTRLVRNNPLNNLPMLGTGSLAAVDGSGALAISTDYSVYASAVARDSTTVLLAATLATYNQAGGWDYTLPATLFTGSNGRFSAYLKVYVFGFSDAAHQVAEWLFDCVDQGS